MKYRVSLFSFLVLFLLLAGPTLALRPIRNSKPARRCWTPGAQPRPKNSPPKRSGKIPSRRRALEFDGSGEILPRPISRSADCFRRALAIDSKDQRRQALKLLTQFTVDVAQNAQTPRKRPFRFVRRRKRDAILVPHALDSLGKELRNHRRRARLLPERESPRRDRAGRDQL